VSKKVERTKTSVSIPELVHSFARAWQSLLGKAPTKEQLAMFVAQNSIETGNRKAMFNYNIGNIIHIPNVDNFDYFENMDSSGGKPFLSKFRAYNSLDEGTLDYLKLLYKGYPQSFQAASGGNPKEYAHSLIANPKHQYYDPTVEKNYASGMSNLYTQYMKSNEFNEAYNSAVGGASAPSEHDELLRKYIARIKEKGDDVYSQLGGEKPTVTPAKTTQPSAGLDSILNKYLQQVSASERHSKKLYNKLLPTNHMVIRLSSDDYTNTVEFARILCAALDEELLATAFTHTDGNEVEVECSIAGPAEECTATVKQLTAAISETFQLATAKAGGIVVKADCITNKKSSYQQMDLKSASTQYRKFLLKFI
jgi:hypothetical protein